MTCFITRAQRCIKILIIVATLSLGGIAFGAETGVTESKIIIGTSRNLSVKTDSRPSAIAEGQRLFIDQANEAGGVFGRKLVLKEYDDAYDPKATVENVKKIIEQDLAFLIFGTYGTANLKAAASLIKRAQIPAFAVSASIGTFPADQLEYLFTVKSTYTDEASEMIHFATKSKKWKQIAVFNQDDALGEEGRAGTLKALHDAGLKSALTKSFSRKGDDVNEAMIAELKKSGAQAVVIFGNEPAGVQIVSAMQKAKFQIPILAGSSLVSSGFTNKVADTTSGSSSEVYFFQGYPLISQTEVPLVAEYKKAAAKASVKANESGLLGYMDAVVLVEALKLTGPELTRKRFLETIISKMAKITIKGIDLEYSHERHSGIRLIRVSNLKDGKLSPL